MVDPDKCKGHAQCVLAARTSFSRLRRRAPERHKENDPAFAEEARTPELLCPEAAFTIIE